MALVPLVLAVVVRVAAVSPPDTGDWQARIDGLASEGRLARRLLREDSLLPGRTHERFSQLHAGLPVFGGELVQQREGIRAISVFGTVYDGIDLDTRPALSAAQARRIGEARFGPPCALTEPPELLVLPLGTGFRLAYRVRVVGPRDLRMLFVDARSGEIVFEYSDLQTEAAVGVGTGVLGDRKKLSVDARGGTFVASDELRPPSIETFDFHGDLLRFYRLLEGIQGLEGRDLAADRDDEWTDGADVDAHVYEGWVYDFYYKRFGRRGLDDANIAVRSIVHPVRREDIGLNPEVVSSLYMNAAYYGGGLIVFGEGLPEGTTSRAGQHWNYLSGGLDVVAHETTHGVTEFSSRLVYQGESGALNESFSDMMATAAEFFLEPPGDGPLQADYTLGEDVITPGGIRSMSNPALYGDPDHYSHRYLGSDDNGGIHSNSAISNQAFYLAIEGGTNRTSGRRVHGVGAQRREDIERVFYRAWVHLLPPRADFAMARAATLQSARDLFGAGSAAEQAVAEAWAAVGLE